MKISDYYRVSIAPGHKRLIWKSNKITPTRSTRAFKKEFQGRPVEDMEVIQERQKIIIQIKRS